MTPPEAPLAPSAAARSPEKAHQEAIAGAVRAAMVYVAEEDGEVVGVLGGPSLNAPSGLAAESYLDRAARPSEVAAVSSSRRCLDGAKVATPSWTQWWCIMET